MDVSCAAALLTAPRPMCALPIVSKCGPPTASAAWASGWPGHTANRDRPSSGVHTGRQDLQGFPNRRVAAVLQIVFRENRYGDVRRDAGAIVRFAGLRQEDFVRQAETPAIGQAPSQHVGEDALG